MVPLETAILTALTSHGPIAAAVAARVSPLGVAPGDVLPYLTYTVTGRTSLPTLADGPADYRKAEFEVGVFAAAYDGAMSLSELVRDRLDHYGGTPAGVELDIWFDDETDVTEAVPEGENVRPFYVREMKFRALYRAAVVPPPTP
jgi:hypothetical protein